MKSVNKLLMGLSIMSLPTLAMAEGNMIGTAPMLDVISAPNVYYQGRVNESMAWTVAVAKMNNMDFSDLGLGTISGTVYGGGIKGYFAAYANGPYYHLGMAYMNVSSSTSGTGSGILPFAVVGYEASLGGLVFGYEAGLGTAHGFGIIGINLAYQF